MSTIKILWRGTTADLIGGTMQSAPAQSTPAHGAVDVDPGAAEEPQAREILAGLPLLAEDWRFVDHTTRFLRPETRTQSLTQYRKIFERGMALNAGNGQENAGRRRANAFLRRWVARVVTRHGR